MPVVQPLPVRVRRRADPLARRILAEILDTVPIYRTLTSAQLEGEVLRLCAAHLRLLTTCLEEDRSPSEAELDRAREGAVLRAQQHVPLSAVIGAYAAGAKVSWQALVEEAAAEDQERLVRYADLLIQSLAALTVAVSESWIDQRGHVVSDIQAARRTLTEALLTGGDMPVGLLERAGVQLGARMRVLAVRLGPAPDLQDDALTEAVAVRRQHQRVIEALEALQGGPALTMLDGTGGALLTTLDDVEDLHAALVDAARAPVWVALSEPSTPGEIAGNWRQARDVRHLVMRLERPPGMYTLDDVLMEYTVMRDATAARQLVQTLEPIVKRPELLDTLEAWFAADFERRTAAKALNIHPNTLDYRLRRASEELGQDLSTAAGTQLLGAALIARRLSE